MRARVVVWGWVGLFLVACGTEPQEVSTTPAGIQRCSPEVVGEIQSLIDALDVATDLTEWEAVRVRVLEFEKNRAGLACRVKEVAADGSAKEKTFETAGFSQDLIAKIDERIRIAHLCPPALIRDVVGLAQFISDARTLGDLSDAIELTEKIRARYRGVKCELPTRITADTIESIPFDMDARTESLLRELRKMRRKAEGKDKDFEGDFVLAGPERMNYFRRLVANAEKMVRNRSSLAGSSVNRGAWGSIGSAADDDAALTGTLVF